ncbi:MAG: hypothetical protein KDA42_10035 [Planctomycetales bacterium]|nr:hypothetical protein [Planctomycetales bacterium]
MTRQQFGREFRLMCLKVAIVLTVGAIVGAYFANDVVDYVATPIRNAIVANYPLD